MKISRYLPLLVFLPVLISLGIKLNAGPYPGGSLRDHGHTASGDGGGLTNPSFSVESATVSKFRATNSTTTNATITNLVVTGSSTLNSLVINVATFTNSNFTTATVMFLNVGTVTATRKMKVLTAASSNANETMGIMFSEDGTNFNDGIWANNNGLSSGLYFTRAGVDYFSLNEDNSFVDYLEFYIPLKAGDAGIVGAENNLVSPPGYIGQHVSSISMNPSNAPATTVYGDLDSMSLSVGAWDVTGVIYWEANGATWSEFHTGVSTFSGNSTTALKTSDNRAITRQTNSAVLVTEVTDSVPNCRFDVSVATTVYLKYSATYTLGTPRATGRLSARRNH